MRSAAAVLVLLVLAASSAQVDPGGAPLAQDRPVNAVAIAADSGRIAVALDDVAPTSNRPGASTWFLYGPDGRNVLQEGGADPEDCSIVFGDCYNDATLVALSETGDKMVVASGRTSGDGESQLLFITRAGWVVSQQELRGVIQDLAISADGGVVAAATSTPGSVSTDGFVYRFTWGSTIDGWEDEVPQGASAVALSPEGDSMAVAAGDDHYRYGSTVASRRGHTTFPGSATAVAMANDGNHMSAAGSDAGRILVYNDGSGNNQWVTNYKASESAVRSIAFAATGEWLAVGDAAGTLFMYEFDPDIDLLVGGAQGVWTANLAGAVADLAFSSDGRYVAAVAGGHVYLFSVQDRGMVWDAVLQDAVGDVAIDGDGETVVAAAGSSLYLYEAVHGLTVASLGSLTVGPGHTATALLAIANGGNRPEDLDITYTITPGITVVPPEPSTRIAAGQTLSVPLEITVVDGHAPGTGFVNVTVDTGIEQIMEPIRVVVPEIRQWSIDTQGEPLSLGIQAGGSREFSFEISNEGNAPDPAPVTLQVSPSSWTAQITSSLSVPAGETRPLVVSMTAPEGARQLARGIATVVLDGRAITAVSATVDGRFEVGLEMPSEITLDANRAADVQITVTNGGNAPDGFILRTTGTPAGWAVKVGPGVQHTIGQLEPGESITVPMTIAAPEGVDPGNATQLQVHGQSLADSTAQSTRSIVVRAAAAETTTPTGSNGSPLPAWALLALVGAAWLRRR